MKTLTMRNVQDNKKLVIIDRTGKVRPVSHIDDDGVSSQCICYTDIVIYKNVGDTQYQFSPHGTHIKYRPSQVEVDKITMKKIKEFLDSDELKLPPDMGWNGIDTIQSLAVNMGLDLFFEGLAPSVVLGSLIGLDTSLMKPKVGTFDLEDLNWNNKRLPDSSLNMDDTLKLLKGVDSDYKDWLYSEGIHIPSDAINWRVAKSLPDVMSVSCILGRESKPLRFNDLIVWRKDIDVPEIISVFDLVTTFKMATNFITLPYVIGEDVTRVMYVLHDNRDSNNASNVIRLFRKR